MCDSPVGTIQHHGIQPSVRCGIRQTRVHRKRHSTGTFGTNNHHILEIHVRNTNGPPTADAGPDQTVQEGSTVSLMDNATDPDADDALSYLWTHDHTLNMTLANTTSISTTFIAPAVNANTTIAFTLTVNDDSATTADSVHITIIPADDPPVIPTNLQATSTISTMTLTWDDPGDDAIIGCKTLSRIPATQPNLGVLVSDTGSADTTYIVSGLEPGTAYAFRITAISDRGESGMSSPVNISTLSNSAPVADAGPDRKAPPRPAGTAGSHRFGTKECTIQRPNPPRSTITRY